MKISYNWLCEILPNLNKIPAQKLADDLTHIGLEVEEIIDQTKLYKGIVVATVIKKDKHPNADKLSLCQVKAGNKTFQVVCGASNVAEGGCYPFATLNTVMPDGLQIKPIQLRGIESNGMLCSEKELQLSGQSAGLLELDSSLKNGTTISQALGLNDIILDIGITPNRGDALSHWGVAQDISALTGLKLQKNQLTPNLKLQKSSKKPSVTFAKNYKVSHKNKKLCQRYIASAIHNVKVQKSPQWLKFRLESLGIRSINNIVDATNYVMLLTGHPVHAFDASFITKNTIIIDSLSSKQKFLALDEKEYELLKDDLVITDAEKTIALAGIVGGEHSGVTDATQNIILETAFFDPNTVRKTAKRLGIQTESSYRFERFVNPESVNEAHSILRSLILDLAGGDVSDIFDSYPHKAKRVSIRLQSAEIERILGIKISQTIIKKILTNLNCAVSSQGSNFVVKPPVSRSDLMRPIDLIEEIARIHGLNQIPEQLPQKLISQSHENESLKIEKNVKDFFISQGFNETIHYSFSDPELFQTVFPDHKDFQKQSLQNPISEELSIMRTSLLPQLLNTYHKNSLISKKGLRFFELRNVYKKDGSKWLEQKQLAGIYAQNPFGKNRFQLNRDSDFYDGKGILEQLFKIHHLKLKQSENADWPFHPMQSLTYTSDKKPIAKIGTLHPELLQKFKIKHSVYYFEIDYATFSKLSGFFEPVTLHKINKLPNVYRDLGLIVPKDFKHQYIIEFLQTEKPDILQDIEIFDVYEGQELPEGTKSLTYSFVYQPESENLTDEQVNQMHFDLVNKMQNQLGVKLR